MPYVGTKTDLPEMRILESKVFGDNLGFFFESFNHRDFQQATILDLYFVQENHCKSSPAILRGLHYQIQHPQGQLVRVMQGAVFYVVVDWRRSSVNFGKLVGVKLSADNKRQMWSQPGFAHGSLVSSESTELFNKTTDYWYPERERSLSWCDRPIGSDWPVVGKPKFAAKDASGKVLAEADAFA